MAGQPAVRRLVIAAALIALGCPGLAGAADAPKACHSAAGKTVACPKVRRKRAPADNGAASVARCRDIHSHLFTRCGGPNAEPVPAN